VLVNPTAIHALLPLYLGRIMSERYGQPPEIWTEAFQQIRVDWDSYWSDLNLSGDEPLADLWEGMFRVTRALFRRMDVVEPPKQELIAFSRILPEMVLVQFDALYPDTRELLQRLHQTGLCLHAATFWTAGMARAALVGGGVFEYFYDRITGLDTSGRFEHDYVQLALSVRTPPENCLLIDRDVSALARARAAGMQTAQIGKEIDLPRLLTRLTIERL
jgi:beta-phosphoglucomutase-like phosphatase (HAD superfamily)